MRADRMDSSHQSLVRSSVEWLCTCQQILASFSSTAGMIAHRLVPRVLLPMRRANFWDVNWPAAWEMTARRDGWRSVEKWKRLRPSTTVKTFSDYLGLRKANVSGCLKKPKDHWFTHSDVGCSVGQPILGGSVLGLFPKWTSYLCLQENQ